MVDGVDLEGVLVGDVWLIRSEVFIHRLLLLLGGKVRPEARLHRLSLSCRV